MNTDVPIIGIKNDKYNGAEFDPILHRKLQFLLTVFIQIRMYWTKSAMP
jgi:hypothetical protein